MLKVYREASLIDNNVGNRKSVSLLDKCSCLKISHGKGLNDGVALEKA